MIWVSLSFGYPKQTLEKGIPHITRDLGIPYISAFRSSPRSSLEFSSLYFALLFFLSSVDFGYPELNKQCQINILEGDTHITRDLGIP